MVFDSCIFESIVGAKNTDSACSALEPNAALPLLWDPRQVFYLSVPQFAQLENGNKSSASAMGQL